MRGVLAVCAAMLGAAGLAADVTAPVAIEPGKAVERQLEAGRSDEFRFVLAAGQYAAIWVDQKGIDVGLAVYGPDGAAVYEGDGNRLGEGEYCYLVSEKAGEYLLRVTAVDKSARPGTYSVLLRDVETATERHRERAAGRLATAKGMSLYRAEANAAAARVIALYEESLRHYRASRDVEEQFNTLYLLAWMHNESGHRDQALASGLEALRLARSSRIPDQESWALDMLGSTYDQWGDKRKAIEYFSESLPLRRAAGNRVGELNTLNHMGTSYTRLGEKRRALECFEQAAAIARELGDRGKEAVLVANMGVAFGDLGEYQRELESYERALALQREMENRGAEATTLNNIGMTYLQLGEYQKALDSLRSALETNRKMNRERSAGINLNSIGRVYAAVGDRAQALRYFEQATEILRRIKDQWALGHTLKYTGEVYAELGDARKALAYSQEALSFARAAGDPDVEGATLNGIGDAYAKLGERAKARENYERALALHRGAGNQRLLSDALRSLGALSGEEGDCLKAAEYLGEALKIARTIHDRSLEAHALADLARVEWRRGDLAQARERAEEALAAFESLRLGILSPRLRASLFTEARRVQELHLQVLARLHAEDPKHGFDAESLYASERGRARSLLELLGESAAEIRSGVDARLLGRERDLQKQISTLAERQARLASGKQTEAEAAAAGKELNRLTPELEQIQSRIREFSPRYAELTQPAPLRLKEIQSEVLDEDTVLLEYALGAEQSFLWAVTRESIEVFELPRRTEIEAVARRAYGLLTARNERAEHETAAGRSARIRQADHDFASAAEEASRMLLKPAAARIGGKRLLIVAEGVLQYLPFGVLPEPGGGGAPLMVKHEIVTAPSASVVAVLRKEARGRKPAQGTLAIVADPVFSADDTRVAETRSAAAVRVKAQGDAVRSGEFARLRFSRREADEIARLAPAGTLKALDFDASRETVLAPGFGEHRIVHFATHSILNNEHPELSGVVLSLFDRAGRPQNGFLRLYDIYNLRLSAELVVLSACQTALGGEIKGEGLIGLTRGFLYAGAPRVVASLWEIDDRTTAEVMKRFYETMLARNERPAAALRAAQIAMWNSKGWEAPYYWGAFTLQGEWR